MVKLVANIRPADYDALSPKVREFFEGRNLTKTSEVRMKEKDIELG